AGFFGYVHGSLLQPILPIFIQEHGGTATMVGLVAAAFSAPSFALRPFVGRIVDTWSLRGVLAISTFVMGCVGWLYPFSYPALLLALRPIHGTSWAGYNTGANTLLSRIAPPDRRGEAIGYFSSLQGLPQALLPAIALWLLGYMGFVGIFFLCAVCGLLACATVVAMPPQPRAAAHGGQASFWRGLLDPDALLPSALELLNKIPQSATVIFIPMYAVHRGIAIESLVFYYLGVGVAGIATRALGGPMGDRVGRGWPVALGGVLVAVALLLISQAHDIVLLTIGGTLAGAGLAITTPSTFALAIDRSKPHRRGTSMATYSMVFQLADGGGSLLWGVLIETIGFEHM